MKTLREIIIGAVFGGLLVYWLITNNKLNNAYSMKAIQPIEKVVTCEKEKELIVLSEEESKKNSEADKDITSLEKKQPEKKTVSAKELFANIDVIPINIVPEVLEEIEYTSEEEIISGEYTPLLEIETFVDEEIISSEYTPLLEIETFIDEELI